MQGETTLLPPGHTGVPVEHVHLLALAVALEKLTFITFRLSLDIHSPPRPASQALLAGCGVAGPAVAAVAAVARQPADSAAAICLQLLLEKLPTAQRITW